ncbi:MAG: rare lipoprotein [Actinomycetota bacterium]|nr:rare lipoprotein [Actinomycetota bacterium]
MTTAALAVVRDRFARHAVDAYLDGVAETEVERVRGKVWATTVSAVDAQMLHELNAATAAADQQEARAAAAIASAATARAQLDAARAALEKTIADRVTYLRALGRAGVRARQTAMGAGAPVRHVRALGTQAGVMQRYRFGPGGVPDGLVPSGQSFAGRASWYGPGFDGHTTASGAIFDQEGWTVAHKTLPLGTILLVSYNGRSVVVLVNDRGPYVAGRVLDLSHGVASALGTVSSGVASVTAEVLIPA